ncbi:MAG TPA: glycosyltransferase family 39 protein [Tepidisphaeraceae bacterium]|nr:glycosyltransferase family 39 protein [Tepidisphaeraceae bacterium]
MSEQLIVVSAPIERVLVEPQREHQTVLSKPIAARRQFWWFLPFFPLLIPWIFFLATGLPCVNFGHHWDEPDALQNVVKTFHTGTFLPLGPGEFENQPGLAGGYYSYPGVIHWIGIAVAASQMRHADGPIPGPGLDHIIWSPKFILKVRSVCVWISSLTVIWVYLAVLALCGSPRYWPEALLAACAAATSWELEYMSRWLATDTIATNFVALAILCAILAVRTSRPRLWLVLAGIATGLAAGTKYPAGAVLLAVLGSAAMISDLRSRGGIRRLIWHVAPCILAVGVTYLITTPGTLIQPWNFIAWMHFNRDHYATSHVGHTILTRWDYLRAMIPYLTLVLLSPWTWVAAILTGCTFIGTYAGLRSWPRAVLPLLVYELAYIWYFAGQHVMIVRNFMILLPVMVILAGVGVGWMARQVAARLSTRGWLALLSAATIWAAAAGVILASGVRDAAYAKVVAKHRTPAQEVTATWKWIRAHNNYSFFLSDKVAAALKCHNGTIINPSRDANPANEFVLAYPSEDDVQWRFLRWPANLRNLTVHDIGPYEINFDYYPNWQNQHIVALPIDMARKIPIAQVERAVDTRDALHAMPPYGWKLVSFLSCGMNPVDVRGTIRAELTRGKPYEEPIKFAYYASHATTMAMDKQLIEVNFSGLNPAKKYILGMSWTDPGGWHREQRVDYLVSGQPPQTLLAGVLLPLLEWKTDQVRGESSKERQTILLPQKAYQTGQLALRVTPLAPPDVVLTETWLYEKR